MVLCCYLLTSRRRRRSTQQGISRPPSRLLLALLLSVLVVVITVVLVLPSRIHEPQHRISRLELEPAKSRPNRTTGPPNARDSEAAAFPPLTSTMAGAPATRKPSGSDDDSQNSGRHVSGPYQNWTPATSRPNTSDLEAAFPPLTSTAGAPATREPSGSGDDSQNSGHHGSGPYQNWTHFGADYEEMLQNLKIYVYPDVSSESSSFSGVFLPHPNPNNPKLGNYFSEHAFKAALLRSSLVTSRPEEADFFFMPFSINAMRNDPRLHSAASISDFVAQYTTRISSESRFWNASGGADHFYVCCHSIGREAASKHHGLHNDAIQVTCSSSYFQRLYISHKDVVLPQVWPRPLDHQAALNPPDARNKLVFFAGRMQNARVREKLFALWGNDTSMDIFSGNLSFPYEEGFRRSRYCLHVKGYEVNTARVSDAIHYGCIPVIISNYYDLPFTNVLDWSKFSIIIREEDIGFLKKILLSVSRQMYLTMYHNLSLVRRHFTWHIPPTSFDSFHMTAYQLWLRRGLHRLSY